MAEDDGTQSVEVVDADDRFEIRLDGRTVGFTQYRDRGAVRVFPHTEVDPEEQGHGLAGRLIADALDATRAAGLQVVPLCPAVRRLILRHPDAYADLVPTDRRAEFGLPPAE